MITAESALYEITKDKSEVFEHLNARQARHLSSALAVYALRAPGETFKVRVTVGTVDQVPAIALDKSLSPPTRGETPLGKLRIKSLAIGNGISRGQILPSGETLEKIKFGVRLPHVDATPASTKPPAKPSLARNVYRGIERRSPMTLDLARETILRRRERALYSVMPRVSPLKSVESVAPKKDKQKAILFGLHWLQTGGAEQWAFESITLAKSLGFTPIIVTDQPSVHPLIASEVFDGCVLLNLNYDSHTRESDHDFARAIFENFNLAGIVLHHSYWLYHALAWFKAASPNLPVVDSLHIIEYLQGGYAGYAAKFDNFIDTHHVISPQLVDWLTTEQKVDSGKIELAPLATLTAKSDAVYKPRDEASRFTICFVGRLSRQKRPDVFLMLVHRLKKSGINVHAIMHGDGEMKQITGELIDRFNLGEDVELRDETHSVSDTLKESDLLVISSINEGITLTTFEANAAGVPVLSANVGSQSSIIESSALLDRAARKFVSSAVAEIKRLMQSDEARKTVWQNQNEAIRRLNEHERAQTLFERLYKKWLV